MLSSTLIILVTCSLDKSREKLAHDVIDNLVSEGQRNGFLSDLVIFDNHSTYQAPLQGLPPEVKVYQSSKNIGYWGALHWLLENVDRFGKNYKYTYVVESDLIHHDMKRLDDCEAFLDAHPDVGGVRTQEFSVRWRWLYDKQFAFLPFSRRRSLVRLRNAINGQYAWFKLADPKARIFYTNLHAKIPAFNRLSAMQKVFSEIAKHEMTTEYEFMKFYYALFPKMAILDGGLYHLEGFDDAEVVHGSWSSQRKLDEFGYFKSRASPVIASGFEVMKL